MEQSHKKTSFAQEPLILAIETSGRLGSVAIAAGPKLLAETTFSGPMRHSAEIFPAICTLLKGLRNKPEDIKHTYISSGPGSFTGLRIAVTMAKSLHLANGAEIIALDTLDLIAANATGHIKEKETPTACHSEPFSCHFEHRGESPKRIAAILDAKRGQFYIAVYNRITTTCNSQLTTHNSPLAIWKKVLPDSLTTPARFLDRFADKARPIWLLGEGLLYYKNAFKAEGVHFFDPAYWSPRAANVHLLGWQKALTGRFADPLSLQPNYLRRPEAQEKRKSPH